MIVPAASSAGTGHHLTGLDVDNPSTPSGHAKRPYDETEPKQQSNGHATRKIWSNVLLLWGN